MREGLFLILEVKVRVASVMHGSARGMGRHVREPPSAERAAGESGGGSSRPRAKGRAEAAASVVAMETLGADKALSRFSI